MKHYDLSSIEIYDIHFTIIYCFKTKFEKRLYVANLFSRNSYTITMHNKAVSLSLPIKKCTRAKILFPWRQTFHLRLSAFASMWLPLLVLKLETNNATYKKGYCWSFWACIRFIKTNIKSINNKDIVQFFLIRLWKASTSHTHYK